MKAIWNNKVLAESDQVLELDGNVFFPISSLKIGFFQESKTLSVCPWKGKCRYFHILVKGEINPDAAWYFHPDDENQPLLKNRVCFWKGVELENSSPMFNAWRSVKYNIAHWTEYPATWLKRLNSGT
jgi:uncharacterized protein (DUF427 family)